jgi:hypothetical protein
LGATASGQISAVASGQVLPKTYGTDDDASLTVNAYEFWFNPAGTATSGPEDFMRGAALGSPSAFIAGVRIPNGAQVRYLQMASTT